MTKLAKAEAALAAHCAGPCQACTDSVTAFAPVCVTLKALIAARNAAEG